MKRFTWMAALAGLLLSACGGNGNDVVLARNLSTGDISSFPEDAVPPDWVVCSSQDCPVPPTVDCQKLGPTVCTLDPACRLKELWCETTACICPPCAEGATCPPCGCPEPKCEYTCVAKEPLLCEELTDESSCDTRKDCEWTDADCACLAVCKDDGKGGCLPCPPCAKACRTKAPTICQQLDETQCESRSDCQWEVLACTQVCQPDGNGGCLPCTGPGTCVPKNPVPPPCPELAPLPPDYCQGGNIVPNWDAAGCIIGYTCELLDDKGCSDLNAAYIAAVAKAKVCNPYSNLAVVECAKLVDSELFCPICPTFVSITATAALQEMDDLRAKFFASCDKMMIACPAIACQAPPSASCLPAAGGLGVCTNDQP